MHYVKVWEWHVACYNLSLHRLKHFLKAQELSEISTILQFAHLFIECKLFFVAGVKASVGHVLDLQYVSITWKYVCRPLFSF